LLRRFEIGLYYGYAALVVHSGVGLSLVAMPVWGSGTAAGVAATRLRVEASRRILLFIPPVLVPRVFIPLAFILLVYEATVPFAAELRDAARASTCESETPSIRAEVSTAGGLTLRMRLTIHTAITGGMRILCTTPTTRIRTRTSIAPRPPRMMKTAECDRI